MQLEQIMPAAYSYPTLFTIEKEIKEGTIVTLRIPEFEVNVYRQLF